MSIAIWERSKSCIGCSKSSCSLSFLSWYLTREVYCIPYYVCLRLCQETDGVESKGEAHTQRWPVQGRLGIDLFDEELCDKRWSFCYYKETQRIFQSSDSANTSSHDFQPVTIAELPVSKKRPKSQVYGCFIYWSKCSTKT